MAFGGFLVKFDGKEIKRCHTVAFNYDEWQYAVNNEEPKEIPKHVKNIEVKVEVE